MRYRAYAVAISIAEFLPTPMLLQEKGHTGSEAEASYVVQVCGLARCEL